MLNKEGLRFIFFILEIVEEHVTSQNDLIVIEISKLKKILYSILATYSDEPVSI
jgi:hypothetical protein